MFVKGAAKTLTHLGTVEEASFEKMGALMAENNSKLLGVYDELSSFLTRIKLFVQQ